MSDEQRTPVFCDEHDVEMVRDEPFIGWRCPQGESWFADEEYLRLTSPRSNATEIRVVGCRETPR